MDRVGNTWRPTTSTQVAKLETDMLREILQELRLLEMRAVEIVLLRVAGSQVRKKSIFVILEETDV